MNNKASLLRKTQQAYIQRLLRDFPGAEELLEYEDYQNAPTQANADTFIRQVQEDFAEPMSRMENYLDYVSHRPGVQMDGEHGLWCAGGKVRNLSQAVREVAEHTGSVWTPVVAIRREDAERLGETTTWLWLKYTLANGQHLMRSYELFLTRERMAQAGTYDYLLDALVNGEAMKAVRLHDGDPDYTLTGGYVSTDLGGSYDLGSREAEAIAAAVRRDAANGTWGTYEWFDSSDAHDYAINMELTFEYQEQDSSGTSYTSTDWITIRVRPEMTETVDCLLRLGLVTKADLVTRGGAVSRGYGMMPSREKAMARPGR